MERWPFGCFQANRRRSSFLGAAIGTIIGERETSSFAVIRRCRPAMGPQSKRRRQSLIAAAFIALIGCDPDAQVRLSSNAAAAINAPAAHVVDPLGGCAVPRLSPPVHIFYVDPAS